MIRRSPGLLLGARRFAFLTSLLLVLSACSFFAEPSEEDFLPASDYVAVAADEVADGGTLTLGAVMMPSNLNPAHVEGLNTDAPNILAPTTGSAVRVLADGRWEVDKNYATSVSVIDRDPLIIEVELSPKAVWEGGTPITSKDMVSFVKAMKDSSYHAAPHPAISDIDEVEVESDLSYRVIFKRPNADWPAVIYPTIPAAVSSKRDVFNTLFIDRAVPSNGPFRVAEVSTATNTIRLERNPRWWGTTPKLDEIIWRFAESEILNTAFDLGELDMAPMLHMEKKAVPEGATLRASASSSWSQLTLNGGRGPLADAKVRQAISLALDRDEFAEDQLEYLGISGIPLDTVVMMPGQIGHENLGITTDVGEAKDLLKEAGWKVSEGKASKGGETLELILPVPEAADIPERRAAIVTKQLAEIGITVKTEVVAADTFYEKRVIPLDFDLVTFTRRGSAFNVSQSRQWFTPLDSPQNFTGKASKAIGSAFRVAVTELDADKRVSAIGEVEEIAHAQASVVPLVVIPAAWVVRDGVVNYGPTQFEQLDWTVVGWHTDSVEK